MIIPESIREALDRAVTGQFISDTHYPFLPTAMPIYAAICAVRLPKDCLPATGGTPRVATGVAPKKAQAEFLARMEGAERYSLQFSATSPKSQKPLEAFGGPAEAKPVEELTLGAVSCGGVSSKGCAAGISFVDASQRAMLELVEHFFLDGATGAWDAQGEALSDDTDTLMDFLATQLKKLTFRTLAQHDGFAVVGAVCSDLDSSRPTFGTSASFSWQSAARKAAFEAVFSWRNMIELERNAVAISEFSNQQRLAIEQYRGVAKSPVWAFQTVKRQFSRTLDRELRPEGILMQLTQQRVSLFDMESSDLKIPVVRATLG